MARWPCFSHYYHNILQIPYIIQFSTYDNDGDDDENHSRITNINEITKDRRGQSSYSISKQNEGNIFRNTFAKISSLTTRENGNNFCFTTILFRTRRANV